MAGPFQEFGRGIVRGKPQAYRPKSAKWIKTPLGKSAMQEAIIKSGPETSLAGLGAVGAAAGIAAALINRKGKQVSNEIDAESKASSDQSNAMTQKLRAELIRRKKATGKSLSQRQDEKFFKNNPMTKSPQGIGVGWR